MIYLIDKVLPESYFVNNLRALSVDMAVFRDLLRMKLPELSQHLDALQRTANKESGGNDGSWLLHPGKCLASLVLLYVRVHILNGWKPRSPDVSTSRL